MSRHQRTVPRNKLRLFPRDALQHAWTGVKLQGGEIKPRCELECVLCMWMNPDRHHKGPTHQCRCQCGRIRHIDAKCWCETQRCDGFCNRNCGLRCGYHIGHSMIDFDGHGESGQHCCCPNRTEDYKDPTGHAVPLEGSHRRDDLNCLRTSLEQWRKRQDDARDFGNPRFHVQSSRDIYRSRSSSRNSRRNSNQGRSRSGSRSYRTNG